ncbi:undecaprenyldiphospho-muramoylpentapeptide beta-N-acetylglucosaminyltransferase [Psittacicella hinzii]|uniref:UDP-N-acetylglucosamine--N-acetylmuramyl-(pentapeptide) pyrophosphoryl-undecaprenol N-acetylglucosamine transferase n=1 Tax=Psittacicella hinzii TaxID=2028575 RepID=A0A3A1YD36_9GAMM|nr:undecaprenyldiphospho-muramoylpentapeptide beta-N-acetylglucosaminyltransferase [Psittacicella hinzii]RIY34124.1 undecaprenyldiphospho-muramoylpentapeptide beta-N-acetylglucosaminyltransferase [Psittacicella hinzii]
MTTKKKVLIVAGGTGGHIFPALAVAQKLSAENVDISWVGTSDRMENDIVPKYGYPLHTIKIEGIVSRGLKAWLKAPFTSLKAVKDSIKILKEIRPNVVVSFGGYVCGPVGIAAKLLGIPLIVLENNGVIGLTNKILMKFANLTLFAYPLPQAKKPEYIVGQPLREDFQKVNSEDNLRPLLEKAKNEFIELKNYLANLDKEFTQDLEYNEENFSKLYSLLDSNEQKDFDHLSFQKQKLNIFAVGGSIGARILNENLAPAVKLLAEKDIYVDLVQQVGKNNLANVEQLAKNLELDKVASSFTPIEFIDNMIERYLASDLIICRSGSMTVFEIASCNRPVIFVPLAHHKDQQQLLNAKYLVDQQAARVILNKDFNSQTLVENLLTLNYNKLYLMAKKQTTLATPQATDKITAFIKTYF